MSEPTTMGAYLRATRRRRRISIEKAAEDTRIRSDFLMRMESDEFDFLAPTYVRGFLRSYTRYLRVPEEPLLKEFDRRFGRRAESQQLAMIEKGRKDLLPTRRKMNSWGVASVMAAAVLLLLGAIGLTQGDPDENRPSRIAGALFDDPLPSPEPSTSGTVEPSPAATVAFSEGVELEVLASNGDCWVEIYADGQQLYYQVLAEGLSETFTAEEKMFVRLGFPEGVELVVNGRNLGSPGGTDPIELTFPDDLEAL